MRRDLLDMLKRITPEEQELLDGSREIRKERYTNRRDFVVDSRLLLEKGRLIEIRPHTRFAYFPKHRPQLRGDGLYVRRSHHAYHQRQQ